MIAIVLFLIFVVISLESKLDYKLSLLFIKPHKLSVLGSARHEYDIPMIWTTPLEIKVPNSSIDIDLNLNVLIVFDRNTSS